ncbi:MAG: hypothetical protein R6V77_01035 [Candidatus Cloacimonadaceae bacterium]
MKTVVLFLIMVAVSVSYAVVVNHIPPAGFDAQKDTELRIEIIQGVQDIAEAAIMYRTQGGTVFDQILMEKDAIQDLWFKGFLPVPAIPELGFEYYFKITTKANAIETLPLIEPEKNPFLLQPIAKEGVQTEDFILLSDEPVVFAKDGYIIAVSWFALEDVIDLETVKLYVNGKNVTARTHVTRNMLLYKNTNPKTGVTTAFVSAITNDGEVIHSKTWTTVVKPSGTISNLPMNLRGSFNAGTNILSTSQDNSANTFGNDRDDGWASLDMYADYDKLRLQSYTYLSTLQREDVQHVNRFRLGVLLPFWDTFIGDYSPSMSSLTMNNKNLRGIYTKLHGKHFGVSIAHGEMVRSIVGSETITNIARDTLFIPGVFKQEAFAARIEMGNQDGFMMGLTTTRNRDVISSLDYDYIFQKTEADTTQRVFPQDNLVISMDTRIAIPKIKFVLGLEGAASLYNTNTYYGAFSSDDLAEYLDLDEGETAPVNPADFQDIFIINTNMQPLPMSKNFSEFAPFLAWQAYLRNFYKSNLLNISISQVGASFKSLSTNYMQNDARQFLISDQFTYQQYLFVGGGFSQIEDNLSQTKLDTHTNTNFFMHGMLRLPNQPYLMLAFNNNTGENELNNEIDPGDSGMMFIPYQRSSNMFSVSVGYDLDKVPVALTNIELGWRKGVNNEKRQDSAKAMTKFYEYDTNNLSLSLTSRFIELPLKTQFAISNNAQDFYHILPDSVNTGTNSNFNFLMRGDYTLPYYRLVPWLEYKLTSLSGDQDKQSINWISLGLDARPFDNTNVSTCLGWQIYSNKDRQDADYKTTTWHLNLTQRF